MVTIGWLSGRLAAEAKAAASPKFQTAPWASASQKLSEGMPVEEAIDWAPALALVEVKAAVPAPMATKAKAPRVSRAAATTRVAWRRGAGAGSSGGTGRESTRPRVS